MKAKGKVKLEWTPSFAYAIGLIASDGNLSPSGRHISFTSKDVELAKLFKKSLSIDNKIGKKARGGEKEKKYSVVQFGDVLFYRFLLEIGLTQAKSRTLGKIVVPDKVFADFLRGCIDGDGNISVTKHPESKHPQLRLRLASASLPFLIWIKSVLKRLTEIEGGWIYSYQKPTRSHPLHELTFGKSDSITLLKYIYYDTVEYYLRRKYKIAEKFLGEW